MSNLNEVYLSKITQSYFGAYTVGYLACVKDVAKKDMTCIKALIDKNTYEDKEK